MNSASDPNSKFRLPEFAGGVVLHFFRIRFRCWSSKRHFLYAETYRIDIAIELYLLQTQLLNGDSRLISNETKKTRNIMPFKLK